MPSDKNVDALEEIKEKLSNNSVFISTGFTGLDVATMTEFRQKLREQGLEYRVVKNTIASLAADEIGFPQIKEVLTGPTGLVMGNGDAAAAAKVLTEFLRSSRIAMPLNGAVIDGQVMTAQEVNALGALPTRPVLMSMLMGQLSGVVARLVRVLNSPAQSLAVVLERSTEGKGEAIVDSAENTPAEASFDSAPVAVETSGAGGTAEATDTAEADETPAEDAVEEDSAGDGPTTDDTGEADTAGDDAPADDTAEVDEPDAKESDDAPETEKTEN